MTESGTSPVRSTTLRPAPATVAALLDHEEALAIQKIADSVQRLGDDLCVATDLRRRIRRHPFLATGIGALAGFVGGPALLKVVQRISASIPSAPNSAPRPSHSLPGLVLATLRGVRARM